MHRWNSSGAGLSLSVFVAQVPVPRNTQIDDGKVPDTSLGVRDTVKKVRDALNGVPDTAAKVPDTMFEMPDTAGNCRIPNPECAILPDKFAIPLTLTNRSVRSTHLFNNGEVRSLMMLRVFSKSANVRLRKSLPDLSIADCCAVWVLGVRHDMCLSGRSRNERQYTD